MADQKDKRSASQRIDDLEQGLISVYQTVDTMARDLMIVKDAIKLLGNKVDSIVKSLNAGEELNDDTIAKHMIDNNVAELKEKVDGMVAQGYLAPSDTIAANSFVVGQECQQDGTVMNPRLQFAFGALAPNVKEKLLGAKTGEVVSFGDDKMTFKVDEVYSIQVPPSAQDSAPEAEPTTEVAPEATSEATPASEATAE